MQIPYITEASSLFQVETKENVKNYMNTFIIEKKVFCPRVVGFMEKFEWLDSTISALFCMNWIIMSHLHMWTLAFAMKSIVKIKVANKVLSRGCDYAACLRKPMWWHASAIRGKFVV